MNTLQSFLKTSVSAIHSLYCMPAIGSTFFANTTLIREFGHGLKSKKSVTKRFDVTGNGKLKYYKAGRRHGNTNKTRDYLREARNARYLEQGGIYKSLKEMIV